MTSAVTPLNPVALAFENLTLGYERHPAVHHLTGEVR
jgi:zinc/manganese transport system ATP-binding protein